MSSLFNQNALVRTSYGMGSAGQCHIDEAYAKLEGFVKSHDDFKVRLPAKHQCNDDGMQGALGMMMAVNEELEGECSIM